MGRWRTCIAARSCNRKPAPNPAPAVPPSAPQRLSDVSDLGMTEARKRRLAGHRPAKQPSLGKIASETPQRLGVFLRFDPFGDDLAPQRARDRDHRSDQLNLLLAPRQSVDQRAIDLDRVEFARGQIRSSRNSRRRSRRSPAEIRTL